MPPPVNASGTPLQPDLYLLGVQASQTSRLHEGRQTGDGRLNDKDRTRR